MDAYEIRLELLKLAQSILTDRVSGERQRLEMDWQQKAEQAMKTAGEKIPSFPDLPIVGHRDVIQVAEELNNFVSNKKER